MAIDDGVVSDGWVFTKDKFYRPLLVMAFAVIFICSLYLSILALFQLFWDLINFKASKAGDQSWKVFLPSAVLFEDESFRKINLRALEIVMLHFSKMVMLCEGLRRRQGDFRQVAGSDVW